MTVLALTEHPGTQLVQFDTWSWRSICLQVLRQRTMHWQWPRSGV